MNDIALWSVGRLKEALGNSFALGRAQEGHDAQTMADGARSGQRRESVEKVERSSRCRRLATAAFIAAGSLWGSAFLFGKLAFMELPISHVALYRFSIATLVLLPLALARRIRPARKDIPHFLLTGFLIAPMTFLPQYMGLALTSASSASLIIGTLPPLLALAAMWFSGERLSGRGWLAIGVSSLGVVLVVGLPGADHNWLGDGLVFLSMFVVVAWVLLSRPLIERYTALGATSYLMLFGMLTILPIALIWDGVPRVALSSTVAASVLVLGLACSALTYVLWNWGLTYVSTSHAGVYTNLEPVVGVLLSVMFLHESLQPGVIVGGLLIIAGAVVITRADRHAEDTGRERKIQAG